ncbi:hypothetical protein NL676_022665 [Syzygium grande]|nr:hypothetical protein NL676_022665 [Syzygium grande]
MVRWPTLGRSIWETLGRSMDPHPPRAPRDGGGTRRGLSEINGVKRKAAIGFCLAAGLCCVGCPRHRRRTPDRPPDELGSGPPLSPRCRAR